MQPVSPVAVKRDQKLPAILETVWAKDQPEYIPLPTIVTDDGQVISRWTFTWRERLRILFGGSLYLRQLTFGSRLQPIAPSLDEPVFEVQ